MATWHPYQRTVRLSVSAHLDVTESMKPQIHQIHSNMNLRHPNYIIPQPLNLLLNRREKQEKNAVGSSEHTEIVLK